METYLYLSMIPESLVASMLPPSEFGTYLAVGTQKRTQGQAMYFEIDKSCQCDYFDLSAIEKRCVPHPDGRPKHSVYLSIYRVLEHVPLEALKSLWLITKDGRALELKPSDSEPVSEEKYHLYQEICPVHPLIASTLDPKGFCEFITNPENPINVPKICFVEMELSELADDPVNGGAKNLPYSHIDHLRDCLIELKEKRVKTVDRTQPQIFPYRSVKTGFFVGNKDKMLYYPMPSREELDRDHHDWWRSVNV